MSAPLGHPSNSSNRAIRSPEATALSKPPNVSDPAYCQAE